MRTAVIAMVLLAAVRAAAAQPSSAPPPVPPLTTAPATPTQPSDWRDGLTLRVGIGMGSQLAADGYGTHRAESSTFSFAIGGYPSRRLALLFQFETTHTEGAVANDNLHLMALAADVFVTDRVVLGGAIGQTTLDDRASIGAEGRAALLLTQRRKHAVDLAATASTSRLGRTQVTTIEVSVAYRFL